MQSVIKKAQCYVYLPCNFPDVSSLVYALETNLFSYVLSNSHHVLHQLLPPEKILVITCGNIPTNLPSSNTQLRAQKKLMYRMLFRDIYQMRVPDELLLTVCYFLYSPNSTWLVTSRLDKTRHVRRVERVETSVSSRAVPTWRTTNKL